jgi:hypothetical protein
MDVYVYGKSFFKEQGNVKSAITDSIDALYSRILTYENNDVPFNKIFNDDHIKYDKQGEFYTFKVQRGNLQLRILYTYLIIDARPVILMADYFIKKKNNKKYIRQFEFFKNIDPIDLFGNSKLIMRK